MPTWMIWPTFSSTDIFLRRLSAAFQDFSDGSNRAAVCCDAGTRRRGDTAAVLRDVEISRIGDAVIVMPCAKTTITVRATIQFFLFSVISCASCTCMFQMLEPFSVISCEFVVSVRRRVSETTNSHETTRTKQDTKPEPPKIET